MMTASAHSRRHAPQRRAFAWRAVFLAVLLLGVALGLQGCASRCSVFDRGYPLCGI